MNSKKFGSLLLAVLLVGSFTACGDDNKSASSAADSSAVSGVNSGSLLSSGTDSSASGTSSAALASAASALQQKTGTASTGATGTVQTSPNYSQQAQTGSVNTVVTGSTGGSAKTSGGTAEQKSTAPAAKSNSNSKSKTSVKKSSNTGTTSHRSSSTSSSKRSSSKSSSKPKASSKPASKPAVKAYNMSAIRSELITYGEARGLHYNSSLTPSDSGFGGVTYVLEDRFDEADVLQSEKVLIDWMIRNRGYDGADFNPYIVKRSSKTNDYAIYELFG